jgi:hypothetical protein
VTKPMQLPAQPSFDTQLASNTSPFWTIHWSDRAMETDGRRMIAARLVERKTLRSIEVNRMSRPMAVAG